MKTFNAVMQDGFRVDHDFDWIKKALQGAIELEFSTIPPYLCAWFSVKTSSPSVWVTGALRSIVLQEMGHLGLVCSILRSIGGQPDLVAAVATYPHPLPANVDATFPVSLQGLNADSLDTFVKIEQPENEVPIGVVPEGVAAAESFKTIGEFYRAIKSSFANVNAKKPIKFPNAAALPTVAGFPQGAMGITPDFVLIDSIPKVNSAIDLIVDQGEGSSQSPTQDGLPNSNVTQLAHFYRFRAIQQGMEIHKQPNGSWAFVKSKPITFTAVNVPPVPAGGFSYQDYTADSGEQGPGPTTLEQADNAFSDIVNGMQSAWNAATAADAEAALTATTNPGAMSDLKDLAATIMNIKLHGSNPAAFYCPQFRYKVR